MYLCCIGQDTFCGVAGIDTARIISGMETWTDRARSRMRELHITQDKLLTALGVTTRGAVGHYLAGRRDPSVEQIIRLADVLDMSLDSLLLGAPIANRETDQSPTIRDLQAVVSRLSEADAKRLLPIVERLTEAPALERYEGLVPTTGFGLPKKKKNTQREENTK